MIHEGVGWLTRCRTQDDANAFLAEAREHGYMLSTRWYTDASSLMVREGVVVYKFTGDGGLRIDRTVPLPPRDHCGWTVFSEKTMYMLSTSYKQVMLVDPEPREVTNGFRQYYYEQSHKVSHEVPDFDDTFDDGDICGFLNTYKKETS